MSTINGNDIALNQSTWDIELTNGDLTLTAGIESIRQNVKQRLWHIKGEWFLDVRKGTDWFNKIWLKNPDSNIVESELKRVILQTVGIINLLDFSLIFTPAQRKITVNFTAKTTAGTLDYSEVI